jgi:hypothetical protein
VTAVVRSSRVPDAFIVGHPKSGTTALYEMLRRHPQVFMAEDKEPWFFGRDPAFCGPTTPKYRDLGEYLALFDAARPGQVCGEATAKYLVSPTAAAELAALNPAARIVAILREPADFVRSLHLHRVRWGTEPALRLRDALAAEPGRPPLGRYSTYIRYVEQIERYRAVFPAEQVLVLVYDDYRRDNIETLRRVFGFLGVDDRFPVQPERHNQAAGARFPTAGRALAAVAHGRGPVAGALKVAVKGATPRRARRGAVRLLYRRVLFTEPPPADEELMAELRTRFAPEVHELGAYLGRDLASLWGYPDA